METETSDSLPFLDVLISKRVDGSLGHSVYRKPTHTDRYLNARSFHSPSVKSSVNRTLLRRAHTISDKEHLPSELKHLNAVLRDNGYRPDKLKFLPNRNAPRSSDAPGKPIAVLPYIGHTKSSVSSGKRILRSTTGLATSWKRSYTPTKTDLIPAVKLWFTEFLARVVKCTSARPVETLRPGSMNTRPTAAEGNVTNLRSSNTLHWFRPCHWLAEGRDYSPREALVHPSYQRGYWDPQTRHCSSGHWLFHQQHMASDPTIHQHSHPTVYWHASTNRQLTQSRHPTHTQYHDGSQSQHITLHWAPIRTLPIQHIIPADTT